MLREKNGAALNFPVSGFCMLMNAIFFLDRFIPRVDSPRCDAKKIAVLGSKLLGQKKKEIHDRMVT